MIFATSLNALRSQPQSIFDLKLSQSRSSSGDVSNFASEFAWLYDQHNAGAVAGGNALEVMAEEAPKAPQQPTDCLFFQQFISVHQSSNSQARGANRNAADLAQINTFLGQLRSSEEASDTLAE